MGITAPSKLLYSLDDLSADQVALALSARRDKNDPSKSRKPHIAIDASVYAHRYRDKGPGMPAHILDFAAFMANSLKADVTIFCDRTNYRSDTKNEIGDATTHCIT